MCHPLFFYKKFKITIFTIFKCNKFLIYMSIREEDITLAVQDIISTIEIPDIVVRHLKDKIISSLDELYIIENQLVDTKNKRIKELDYLMKKSYENKLLGMLPPWTLRIIFFEYLHLLICSLIVFFLYYIINSHNLNVPII